MLPQNMKVGDTFNDITCESMETVVYHIHPHLAIFFNGTPIQVPYGIGIGQPWTMAQTATGPFVSGGQCFSWLHTHTGDGIIHVESPTPKTYTLGDFFAVWGQPLDEDRVGPLEGQVFAYVNGERVSGDPSAIQLTDREGIQLNIGTDTPPYQTPSFAGI
jgi:hypothetical protein